MRVAIVISALLGVLLPTSPPSARTTITNVFAALYVIVAASFFGIGSSYAACVDFPLSSSWPKLSAQANDAEKCTYWKSTLSFQQRYIRAADCAKSSWGYTGGYFGADQNMIESKRNIEIYCRDGSSTSRTTEAQKRPSERAPKQEPPASVGAKSASCSDITGTSSSAPAATHCKNADRSLYAARQMRKANPQAAAAEYKKAAVAARNAGDTRLELVILREAADPDGADSPANTDTKVAIVDPPRSAPPPATPLPLGQLWDGRYETCNTAKELERATAAWYYECVLSNQPKATKSLHRPNPEPVELGRQAREACGSYSRDTQQCYSDFKLKVILAQNPGMREACEKKASEQSQLRQQLSNKLGTGDNTRQKFLGCVDNAYLYGDMDGSPNEPKVSMQDSLRKAFERQKLAVTKVAADGRQESHACWAPGRCCPPGQGMKQTPGAFGASSCQLLGGFLPNSKSLSLDAKVDADRIEQFEQRVNAVAINSVAAAIAALGATMSEADRAVCEAASLSAAWSVLKGGVANVPEKCRAMANATVGHLPFYADYHVDNTSDPLEDILANFRSDALTDAFTQQRAECVRRGGMIESCRVSLEQPQGR